MFMYLYNINFQLQIFDIFYLLQYYEFMLLHKIFKTEFLKIKEWWNLFKNI